MGKIIIVTGASGFIAQQLITDLLNSNYYIIGIDIKQINPIFIGNHKYKHLSINLTNSLKINPYEYFSVPTDIVCVCHLAAKIRVDESMKDPVCYYDNNIIATINLLKWCLKINIKNIIFASTAAVYSGNCCETGFSEKEIGLSVPSVYGRTKLMCEQILQDAAMQGFRGYIFRFFNVCGGHEPELIHLLPIIVNNLKNNKDINIYGTDYQTRDGTCLRDYIHLKDISQGFISAINNGFNFDNFKIYNLGSGSGYTVKEILNKTIEIYTKLKGAVGTVGTKIIECPRRAGDSDVLLANSNLAKSELNWTPQCDLTTMISDTINSY